MSLHVPTHGGRLNLELVSVDESAVVYRLALRTEVGAWAAEVRLLLEDGAIRAGEWDRAGAPEWLEEKAQGVLRALWTARRRAPESPWPRRIRRWRAAPLG